MSCVSTLPRKTCEWHVERDHHQQCDGWMAEQRVLGHPSWSHEPGKHDPSRGDREATALPITHLGWPRKSSICVPSTEP